MSSAFFFKTGIVPVAVSLATFSFPFFANAQSDTLKLNELLFSKTHISFSLNPNYSKSKVKLTSGTQNMTPVYMVGLEGGINFIFNPNKNIGIKTGLHFGRQPLDWSYTMNQPYDTINNYYAQSSAKDWVLFARQYYSYISIPLQLEWRTPLNSKTYFTAAGGINLGTSLSYSWGVNDNSFELEIAPPISSFRTNYATSAGLSFVLKNNNLLFVNATANFSHNDLIKGDFAFYSPTGVISTGTYSKGGSSLGLEFGYRFTQEKKAARMVSKPAYKYSKQRARLNTKILRSNLDTIFSHNQIEVNIGKQINLKPTIKTEKGSKPDVTGLPNSMLSAAYTFNINRHWGIKTGLEMGAIIYQYNNLQYFDSASNKNYHGEIYFYEGTYCLNVSVNYHYPICRNILLEANAGLNTTRLFEGGGTYVYGMGREGQNYIEGSTSDKFGYGSKVGLGVLFANKNYNLWRIGIDYKYSFSAAATESYVLNRGYANEQTGTVKVKGDYIALSVGYVYSFARSPYAKSIHRLKVDADKRVRKP